MSLNSEFTGSYKKVYFKFKTSFFLLITIPKNLLLYPKMFRKFIQNNIKFFVESRDGKLSWKFSELKILFFDVIFQKFEKYLNINGISENFKAIFYLPEYSKTEGIRKTTLIKKNNTASL